MDFGTLLSIVGEEPVFETGLVLAGAVDPADVRRQLSRWVGAGKVVQLRRGLYALAKPYRKVQPHPFLVANRLVRPSYVSLQSALAYFGLIPEYVAITTSVTTGRPGRRDTNVGSFGFRHLKPDLFFGYALIDLGNGQQGFVATPEKALLDLIRLQPRSDSLAYLTQLRLQHLDQLNLERLGQLAERCSSPKLGRAVRLVRKLAQAEAEEYEPL